VQKLRGWPKTLAAVVGGHYPIVVVPCGRGEQAANIWRGIWVVGAVDHPVVKARAPVNSE
jgi:hypothetical protein